MWTLGGSNGPSHQHDCVLAAREEGVVRSELCLKLASIIADPPLDRIERGIDRVAMDLGGREGGREGGRRRREGGRERGGREREGGENKEQQHSCLRFNI